LPELKGRSSHVPHAPKRNPNLSKSEEKQAVRNALRYFPKELHGLLAQEFYS
jgi:urocanate hydratase